VGSDVHKWLLIEHGSVIDGRGTAPMPSTSVLVRDNRIAAVGDGASPEAVPRGEDLTVIDATERTVMPGLIDAHCHLAYGESFTQEEQDLYTGVEARTLRSAFNAQRMLRAGVTGISQPGGSYFIGVGVRDAIRAGMVPGPRMTTAGRYITTSNGLADFYPDSVGRPQGSVGTLTNTLDEMRTEIRKQVKNGVDLIKCADSPYGEYQAFSDDEMKGIADLVHQLNRRVTIHARGSAEVGAAVAAGFDWIMHGNVMTDDVIERLAESRTPLVPTLLLLANIADYGHLVGTPAGERDGCKRMLEKTAATLHKAREAGVVFLLGTDTGFAVTPYGEWHARELELLMDYAGLSPLEAIKAATGDAGIVLNLPGQVGVVTVDALADLLVVDGDPSRDIRILQDPARITHVIQDGRVLSFPENGHSWPYDRSIVYSTSYLTRDLVTGKAEHAGQLPSLPWGSEESRVLAADIHDREVDARIPAE
jgi:imidazolonepropionase-like amidohydrolase